MYLTSTSDKVQLVTSSTAEIDVHADWDDQTTTTYTPGRTNAVVNSIGTTDIVAAPGASTQRRVHRISLKNLDSSNPNTIKVWHTDGTLIPEIFKTTLAAGERAEYAEGQWRVYDDSGYPIFVNRVGSPAVNALNIVVLASDVVNNNAVANTIADVTGLSFSVTSGQTYYFEFVIPYTSAATTTGSRWSINGPANPTLLNYRSEYTLTATSMTLNSATAYDIPAASSASSLTTGNVATIWGIITPSASGTVIARFASEVTSSAITAKAGAMLRWVRVL